MKPNLEQTKTDLEPWKTNLTPWKTMKIHPEPIKTMKTDLEPWETLKNQLWIYEKPTWNHEKPTLDRVLFVILRHLSTFKMVQIEGYAFSFPCQSILHKRPRRDRLQWESKKRHGFVARIGVGNIIKKIINRWYWHFSNYQQIIDYNKMDLGIIEKLLILKICIWFHPISTVPKTRVSECLISRTNMNLSLKTVHKVEWQYSPNIMYCKICPFHP